MLKSLSNVCSVCIHCLCLIDYIWREVFVQRLYGIVSPWPPVPTVLKHYTKTENALSLFPPTLPPTPILSIFFIILLHMLFFLSLSVYSRCCYFCDYWEFGQVQMPPPKNVSMTVCRPLPHPHQTISRVKKEDRYCIFSMFKRQKKKKKTSNK